nr:RNA-directed DNA polymerase, eukaryota, reverse transcriptase zinc-binding domain protein [Tanacetum cinerariifolium]
MPRGGVEQENYGLLCSKVADLVLPNILDIWCWSLEGSQEFSVKSSRILIDNTILPKAEVPTRWLRVVPIKGSLVLGFPSISLVTVSGQSGTLVGQESACHRGCGRRLPSTSLLRKCLICMRLETSRPQPAYLLGLVAARAFYRVGPRLKCA